MLNPQLSKITSPSDTCGRSLYSLFMNFFTAKFAVLSHTNTYAMQFLNYSAVFVLYPRYYRGCSLLQHN